MKKRNNKLKCYILNMSVTALKLDVRPRMLQKLIYLQKVEEIDPTPRDTDTKL